MSGVKGSLIGVKINGIFVKCETSCDFSTNVEMLPASSVVSGRWKEFIAGIRDWNVSVNGRLLLESAGADAKTILLAIQSGLPLFIEFRTRPSADLQLSLSGKALPSSLTINAPFAGKATWTANFQGSGPLATTIEDLGLIINAMPIEADYPVIVNEDVI